MKGIRYIKQIGFIFSCFLLIIFMTNFSCNRYELQHDYMITDIALESYIIELNHDSLRVIDLRPGTVIDSNEFYGLNIIFTDSVTQIIDLRAYNINLVNKAYASQPSVSYYVLINKIDSIKITTLKNLDTIYSEGTDVSNLFYVYIRNAIYDPFRTYFDYNIEFINNRDLLSNIDLVLLKKPKSGSIMQFETCVYFKDSTVSTLKTEEIIIK